ncbi:MAG: substrate-binding domain-containing protein [Synergistaceae bacterium]|nr:substrate-binding domain-containing protein [Synergistaceae bacterium]
MGLNTWGTAPILQLYGDEAEWAVTALGLTDSRASDDNKADQEVQNIENFISQGVDGLGIQGYGASTIPTMADAARAAKIPFVLYMAIGSAEIQANLQKNNEYFAGAVASDLVADGHILGEQAIKDGNKTACIIGGNLGDLNMDNRANGFKEAFLAGGGKIVAEERCTDNSEALAKASSMLSAHPDVDAVYMLVGDYVEGTFTAIDQLGIKDVKTYLSAINAGSAPYIKEGKIAAASGGTTFAANIAPALLLNFLDGHPLKNDAGLPPIIGVSTSLVVAANIDAYTEVFLADGAKPVTKEMIQKLAYRFNSGVTYASFIETIKNDFTVDAILKANGK